MPPQKTPSANPRRPKKLTALPAQDIDALILSKIIPDLAGRTRRSAADFEAAWRVMKRLPPLSEAGNAKVPVTLQQRHVLLFDQMVNEEFETRGKRWLVKDTFNRLVFRLNQEGLVESPYLQIPVQVPRPLLVDLTRTKAEYIDLIIRLDRHLRTQGLAGPQPSSLIPPLAWWTLSTATLATLEGASLKPAILDHLFRARMSDMDLKEGWIWLPAWRPGERRKGEESSQPLQRPVPISVELGIHIFRLTDAARRSGWTRSSQDDLFPERLQERRKRDSLLRKHWGPFLRECASPVGEIPDFREVRRHVPLALARVLPPFVVACLGGEYQTRPMTRETHAALFTGTGQRMKTKTGRLMPPPRPGRSRRDKPREDAPEIFHRVERLRLSLKRNAPAREMRELGNEIIKETAGLRQDLRNADSTRDHDPALNVLWYAEWLAEMLQTGRSRPNTVLTYASSIAERFQDLFLGTPIVQWTSQEWENVVRETIGEHETAGAIRGYRAFIDFLVGRGRISQPQVPWKAIASGREEAFNAFALASFDDFDHALSALNGIKIPIDLEPVLRILMILGFFLGLRVKEALRLRLGNIVGKGDFTRIQVRETKSNEGIRKLPLRFLVPEPYLGEILRFREDRLGETRGNLDAPFLTTARHGTFYDTSYLSSIAGLAIRMAIPESMNFHSLRHSFACWFLVRWAAAVKKFDPTTCPFAWARGPVFDESMIEKMRVLLLGEKHIRKGAYDFSHGIVYLCALLGHLNPATTLERYCHTVEVVCRLLRDSTPAAPLGMTIGRMGDILNVSYKSVPAGLKEKGKAATAADLLAAMLSGGPRRGPARGHGGRKRRSA